MDPLVFVGPGRIYGENTGFSSILYYFQERSSLSRFIHEPADLCSSASQPRTEIGLGNKGPNSSFHIIWLIDCWIDC